MINDKLIPNKYKQGLIDIENLKEVELFSGNGIVAPITLSDDASNYKRIDVYAAVENVASYGLAKASVFPNLSGRGMLFLQSAGNGWASLYCYRFVISGTSLTKNAVAMFNNNAWSQPATDNIKIYKVIGYK